MADDYDIMDLGEGNGYLVTNNQGDGVRVEAGAVTGVVAANSWQELKEMQAYDGTEINIQEHRIEGVTYTSLSYPECSVSVPLDLYIKAMQEAGRTMPYRIPGPDGKIMSLIDDEDGAISRGLIELRDFLARQTAGRSAAADTEIIEFFPPKKKPPHQAAGE